MRIPLPFLTGLTILILFSSCSDNTSDFSDFCLSLNPVHRILEDPDWYVWDVAPIYDEEGKVHLFVGRWPKESGMSGWLQYAEIAHAVSDSPEGPFVFKETVFKYAGDSCWDQAHYNPNIHMIGERYVMLYSGRRRQDEKIYQQIGMAFAGSLDGPWEKSSRNPVVPYSDEPGSWNCVHASNPSLVQCPDGSYRIYYKGISDTPVPHLRTIGMAYADHIEGPYRDYEENPLISYIERGGDVEDPYAFCYRDNYFMILEDRMGVARAGTAVADINNQPEQAGGIRPGLLYTSDDGIRWDNPMIGYQTNDVYFDELRQRFERPQILWKGGKPEYLFLALKGGKYNLSSGAVLKIENWK